MSMFSCEPARMGGARLAPDGAIAQLGERLVRNQEVAGSSPASSIGEAPANEGFLASLALLPTARYGRQSTTTEG
jgi:hypothetical protein